MAVAAAPLHLAGHHYITITPSRRRPPPTSAAPCRASNYRRREADLRRTISTVAPATAPAPASARTSSTQHHVHGSTNLQLARNLTTINTTAPLRSRSSETSAFLSFSPATIHVPTPPLHLRTATSPQFRHHQRRRPHRNHHCSSAPPHLQPSPPHLQPSFAHQQCHKNNVRNNIHKRLH